jgi:hypothetical protein
MIVETLCSSCRHYFSRVRSSKGGGRAAQYCSQRCRQAAYRDRVTIAQVIKRLEDHSPQS